MNSGKGGFNAELREYGRMGNNPRAYVRLVLLKDLAGEVLVAPGADLSNDFLYSWRGVVDRLRRFV